MKHFYWLIFLALPVFGADVTDDFNRSDGALGANWTTCKGLGLAVISNTASSANSGAPRGSCYTGTALTDDQYAEVTISGKGSGEYFSVLLRCTGADATRDCYQVTLGGTNEYYITRVDDGTGFSPDLADGTTTFTDGDVLRGEFEGTTIRLKVNGVIVDEDTDATYTSGNTGIEVFWDSTPVPTFDDFAAGDIGASSGSSIPAIFRHLRQMKQ